MEEGASSGEALEELALSYPKAVINGESKLLREVRQEVLEYLAGRGKKFSAPLDLQGTPFQLAVWKELIGIPYGETRSYGQIAAKAGSPKAARAAGMACNRNPVAIIVPCHRVVGSDGRLVGYAGGLEIKRRLLYLEQGLMNLTPFWRS
ncbi:MAG: methylated-DNA--[protein]-cysteine S-methyltransferase [Nitrospinae bacterium]|nr:methylated-DNA--[protein]-cysteine S-methyltransferase [Nitrospinota bacterium]